MAKVLILCPTFDHADAIFASIASVQAQTFREWEMAVICDGSPPRTDEVLAAITPHEPRIRVYRYPKGDRFGEIYRDPVIRDSDAEFICHLNDDDVWMGDHLAQMIKLLERAEWVNQAPLRFSVGGAADWMPVNHGTPAMREGITRRVPVSAGLNYVGYRRDTYLRLPEGWTCAPPEALTSDVYMWAKFFRLPQLTVASSAVTSALKFPSLRGVRAKWKPENRLAETAPWLARAAEPGLADRLRRGATVWQRFIRVFGVHGTGPSLKATFGRCGFVPVSADTPPQPAVDGEPMLVPLTPAQMEEAEDTHLFVRAYAQQDGAARSAWCAAPRGSQKQWVSAALELSHVAGVEVGFRAFHGCADTFPDNPAPLDAGISLALRSGRKEEASRYADRLARKWPEHPALAKLKQ